MLDDSSKRTSTSYSQLYYQRNKEAILAQQRVRRQTVAYKAKMRKYYADYYVRNRARILKLSRERRQRQRRERVRSPEHAFGIEHGCFYVRFD